MKVIITGAYGFVGKNLVNEACDLDVKLFIPSRQELDLLRPESIHVTLNRIQPDVIIHAAGRVGGILANVNAQDEFLFENAQMGLNLLKVSSERGVKRLYNLGSSCMYPANVNAPLTSDMLFAGNIEPTNFGYATAKLLVAAYCNTVRERYGLNYVTVIPPNLYGPYDNFDLKSSHMIASAIVKVDSAIKRGSKFVEIWGDGHSRREFMYVIDFAKLLWRIIIKDMHVPAFFNLGVGVDHSVFDYYKAVSEVLSYKGEYTFDLTKPNGVRQKLLDSTEQLKFGLSGRTSLNEGLVDTYKYYREVILGDRLQIPARS
jgi:GDP-L-fucose synthase